ncbi:MAG: Unknown protein [uncultured Sulfurovum sp.]|uniref:Prokaryotic metallothionein family protein n=1 Tax=uncultured Sulfurovum sp. TaxID=269237 RepID=A0A6S6TV98_9BACT|nr:MAG: Unknown protein [uncultured Sulfurovum sp.]
MWLKIIFVVIVLFLLYRLVGGKIPFFNKTEKKKGDEEHEFGQIETTSECAACGTYVTEEDALIYQKKAYCSSECINKIK